jgi:ABC-type branched-subunit amino acid transport system substrate-binding protein
VQTENGFDYYVNKMDFKGKKLCTITSDDPYGQAGLQGAKFAVDKLGTKLTDSETFTAGATDLTAQVDGLKSKGCEMVWITSLPSDLPTILGRAAQTNYAPQWFGQSPTWVSVLLQTGLKDYMEQHFILASEGVAWDSNVAGMKELRAALQKYSPSQKPDIYFVYGYMEAHAVTQLLAKAVELGDLSRDGIMKAMADIGKLDFGGLVSSEAYGLPADRVPQRETSFFKPTASTLNTNGGLTPLGPDAINYTSTIGKEVPLK